MDYFTYSARNVILTKQEALFTSFFQRENFGTFVLLSWGLKEARRQKTRRVLRSVFIACVFQCGGGEVLSRLLARSFAKECFDQTR